MRYRFPACKVSFPTHMSPEMTDLIYFSAPRGGKLKKEARGMRVASARQMKELDTLAIENRHVPSVLLMENAARAIANEVLSLGSVRRCAVFCGPGNNGGDGLAAARFLTEEGVEVHAYLVGIRDKMTPDCAEMERRFIAETGEKLISFTDNPDSVTACCKECDAIVDAIFGIGLNKEVRGEALSAIEIMNRLEVPVIAADIASGVETDTGRILGSAVEARKTVTFTLPKIGQFVGKGALCTGALTVADIGIPSDLEENFVFQVSVTDPPRLPRRRRDAHKGDFGKVYILAGSVGYTGAPVFAANAAVRTGSGLVFLGVPDEIWPVVAVKCDEAMPSPIPAEPARLIEKLNSCDAVLVGPGLGRSAAAEELVLMVLSKTKAPLVLDADGINAVSKHIDILDARRGRLTVVTPHDGEFARLGGDLSGGDRLGAAQRFASDHGCVLVLKGHRTITAFPDGTAFLNTTGNPGMAKGGSGDVLAGMIVSLLGQGFPPETAVPAAVWLHGRVGDLAAREKGEYGMTPGDMIDEIPYAVKSLQEK